MSHPQHPPIMGYPMAGAYYPPPPQYLMPYGPTPPMPALGGPPPPATAAPPQGDKKEAGKKAAPAKDGDKKDSKKKEESKKSDDKKDEKDGDTKEDDKKEGGLDLLASLAMPGKKSGNKKEEDSKVAAPVPVDGAAPAGETAQNAEAAGIAIVQMDGPTTSKKPRKKSRVEETSPKEKLFVEKVRDVDVLCGRGGKSNHHPGNKRYRQVVSEMKRTYQSTGAKTAKTDLSRAIVEHVVGYGGRFIKRDEATGQYFLLTKAQARRKTSQALRETKELKWTM